MAMHKGRIVDKVKDFDVIDCEECGFIHINPVPTAEELKKIYNEEYYSVEKPLYFEYTKDDIDWWNLVYEERYRIFEKHLSSNQRCILDIGSGPGYFLLHGKQRGWQTLGIEPSKQAVIYSRKLGLEVIEDFLNNDTSKQIGTFDMVHMSNVLEHIPDPYNMLNLAYDLLNHGGLICVVVPNDYNPFQYALKKACNYKPWWVAPPHHINYFSFESLGSLLNKTGFNIVWQGATFPIDMFLLMGDNYIDNNELGRKCHAKRKAFEQNLALAGLSELKLQLYQKLAEIGLGREAVIIGAKK